jgi:hypothetical protein
MREQIRRAFDAMTEAPHPALRSALRARLESGQGDAPPRYWRLTVAVTLAAGLVGLAFVASLNLVPRGGTLPAPAATTTASATPTTPEPTPTPTAPSPSPSVLAVPPSACPSATGGTPAMSNVTDVRVGTTPGYDRLVIQFDGPVPSYTVTPQGSATFMQDGSGQVIQLQGSNGVKIVVHGASGSDLNGKQTFFGPLDRTTGFPVLKEARQIGDFERNFSWGLGLSQPDCAHVTTLSGPDRLVVDIVKP